MRRGWRKRSRSKRRRSRQTRKPDLKTQGMLGMPNVSVAGMRDLDEVSKPKKVVYGDNRKKKKPKKPEAPTPPPALVATGTEEKGVAEESGDDWDKSDYGDE